MTKEPFAERYKELRKHQDELNLPKSGATYITENYIIELENELCEEKESHQHFKTCWIESMVLREKEKIASCSKCKHFIKDSEFENLGSCNNDNFHNEIIVGHSDLFLISCDFGCKHYTNKEI